MCSDENGDYPAGSFLLNPAGFRHAPFSRDGCVLFVKLGQFPGEGRDHVVVDTKAAEWRAAAPGVELLPLYRDEAWPEDIAMLRLAPGSLLPADYIDAKGASKGLELFFVSGRLAGDGARYNAGAWLREPHGVCPRFPRGGHTPHDGKA